MPILILSVYPGASVVHLPVMQDPVTIRHLTPKNFLSFGPDNPGLELKALNVLIGPNGCGKSNFIEALNFMRASVRDFRDVISDGGGVQEWIWKGQSSKGASVDLVMNRWEDDYEFFVSHTINFQSRQGRFSSLTEKITVNPNNSPDDLLIYQFSNGQLKEGARIRNEYKWQNDIPVFFESDISILAQPFDPVKYKPLLLLLNKYKGLRIYRNSTYGRDSVLRLPEKADSRNDYLMEDFSNLGLFLNNLKTQSPKTTREIVQKLSELYEGITNFDTHVNAGTVQLYLTEGDFNIPATRLSDGTLHYLCLLAILCDPKPPPVICIEEPEVGLHPDILPEIAKLLISASERTQLIVTTHSEVLVDALTDMPDAVVVCSKEEGQTKMERLKPEEMKVWLQKYRLGDLWTSGQIGGNRW